MERSRAKSGQKSAQNQLVLRELRSNVSCGGHALGNPFRSKDGPHAGANSPYKEENRTAGKATVVLVCRQSPVRGVDAQLVLDFIQLLWRLAPVELGIATVGQGPEGVARDTLPLGLDDAIVKAWSALQGRRSSLRS